MVPDIHFCRSVTGARLAFATFGEGPVLLITPPWISSLEVQFEDPAWMGFYSRLARHHTVLVYDKQGCGLSERERTDFTWERDVEDAQTVVDQLAPDRLSIFGASQGGPIAIAFAVRRREQVEKLVLYDTYARGADIARDGGASFVGLVRSNWGLGSRAMAALFLPENLDDPMALGVVLKWERTAATREMATRLLEALFAWDLSPLLSEVQVPTLVLHRRGDKAFHTGLGRDLAAGIPKARFVLLEGSGHLPWYGDCDAVLSSVAEFLGDDVADTLRPLEIDTAGTAVPDGAPAGGRPAVAPDGAAFQVVHRDLLHEHGQLQMDRCRIGLAQVPLSVDSFEVTSSGMLALRREQVDEVRRKLAAMVATARSEGVDLLLLPELAVDLKVDALRADLFALAAETGMTIVPGSYHDVAGGRNVATPIGPEGILWEQDKQLPAILHIDGKPWRRPSLPVPSRWSWPTPGSGASPSPSAATSSTSICAWPSGTAHRRWTSSSTRRSRRSRPISRPPISMRDARSTPTASSATWQSSVAPRSTPPRRTARTVPCRWARRGCCGRTSTSSACVRSARSGPRSGAGQGSFRARADAPRGASSSRLAVLARCQLTLGRSLMEASAI